MITQTGKEELACVQVPHTALSQRVTGHSRQHTLHKLKSLFMFKLNLFQPQHSGDDNQPPDPPRICQSTGSGKTQRPQAGGWAAGVHTHTHRSPQLIPQPDLQINTQAARTLLGPPPQSSFSCYLPQSLPLSFTPRVKTFKVGVGKTQVYGKARQVSGSRGLLGASLCWPHFNSLRDQAQCSSALFPGCRSFQVTSSLHFSDQLLQCQQLPQTALQLGPEISVAPSLPGRQHTQ